VSTTRHAILGLCSSLGFGWRLLAFICILHLAYLTARLTERARRSDHTLLVLVALLVPTTPIANLHFALPTTWSVQAIKHRACTTRYPSTRTITLPLFVKNSADSLSLCICRRNSRQVGSHSELGYTDVSCGLVTM
jgi:hypothetical protein